MAHELIAPDGSRVSVASADRRDTLLSRGYKAARTSGPKGGDDESPAPAKRTTKRTAKKAKG